MAYVATSLLNGNGTVQQTSSQLQGGPKQRGHRLMTIILSNLNRFKTFTGRFLGNFAVKWILKIPPHLAYVAALPCETLMSAKQAINDKFQGSVATYLRCGGVVNNQIKKGLLTSLSLKKIKIGEYLPSQHTAKRRRKCTRQSRSCLKL